MATIRKPRTKNLIESDEDKLIQIPEKKKRQTSDHNESKKKKESLTDGMVADKDQIALKTIETRKIIKFKGKDTEEKAKPEKSKPDREEDEIKTTDKEKSKKELKSKTKKDPAAKSKSVSVQIKSSLDRKIFVLDTSVILYNHNCIKTFDDNDVALPITVLEELDNFKKGNDNINFEAREFIRIIDRMSEHATLTDWIPLEKAKGGKFKVIMNERSMLDARLIFDDNKPDHRILNAALSLSQEFPERKVVLVSKDINLRLKAKSLNITAEDYLTGKIKNVEGLYTGIAHVSGLPSSVIDKLYKQGWCKPKDIGYKNPTPNLYFILKNTNNSALAYYNAITERIERIEKRTAFRIVPRNAEQVFAMHAVLNPDVKLVTLQGVAGTGKTLIALASALEQKRNFKQVFLARPVVPLSNKDLGFLPGDIKSKMNPYMEPLNDNLKFIQSQYSEKDKEFKNITDSLENEKLVVQPLAYIRGRSISNVCFIVDEAQNLTPHEIKTIITRAGQNTKIIFTGDIYQIDTPYLDAQSNGLSYLIDKIKHHAIYAHVRLEKGERSELANLANDLL